MFRPAPLKTGLAAFGLILWLAVAAYGEDSLSSLIDQLADKDPKHQETVIAQLVNIGEPAVSPLIEALRIEIPETSAGIARAKGSAEALAALAPLSKKFMPQLLATAVELNQQPNGYRLTWLYERALNGIGMRAGPEFESLYRGSDANSRKELLRAGGSMKPVPPEVIRILQDALVDSDEKIRVEAVGLTRQLGHDAAPLFPYLLRDLRMTVKSNSDIIRQGAYSIGWAMASCGGAVIPQLIEALSDEDPAVREVIAYALGTIGSIAGGAIPVDAIPALTRSLRDSSPHVRERAINALGVMGPVAQPAVPFIVAELDPKGGLSSPEYLRGVAARALGQIGWGDEPLVDALMGMLHSTSKLDRHGRESAVWALGRIQPPAEKAVTTLDAMAKNDSLSSVRQAARMAVTAIHFRTSQPEPLKLSRDVAIDDVYEAGFKYLIYTDFDLHRAGDPSCISLDGHDPPSDFLRRFHWTEATVKPGSEWPKSISAEGVTGFLRLALHGLYGLFSPPCKSLFWLGRPEWISDSEVKLEWSYYCGDLCGHSGSATFVRFDGKWQIIEKKESGQA